jgi:Ammonium Transporter Family
VRRAVKLAGLSAIVTIAGLMATATTAFADTTGSDIIKDVGDLKGTAVTLNLLWIVIGAVLVIFMQAGFALVETGFCQAKHAAHVVTTNFAIFGLGFVAFYLVGFGFMCLLGDDRRRRRTGYRHVSCARREVAHR